MFPWGGSWCHRCCSRSTSLCFGGNHWSCWQRVLFCQGALFFSPCVTSPTLVPHGSWSHTRNGSFCPFPFCPLPPIATIIFHFHLSLILSVFLPPLFSLSGLYWHRQIPLTLPLICPCAQRHTEKEQMWVFFIYIHTQCHWGFHFSNILWQAQSAMQRKEWPLSNKMTDWQNDISWG